MSKIRKIQANQIELSCGNLKQVSNTRQKQLFQMSEKQHIIIIDYGSQMIKVGFDWSQNGPQFIFRSQVSRNRDNNRSDQPIKTAINTSYDQLDFSKSNFKSPYERNIILHFSLLENCNDFIFSEICKPNKKISSPLIISEPFANPIHCRNGMLEQFFLCYEIESVMIGVDALFAYFYEINCNIDRYESQTAFIINLGATTTHVAAMLRGKLSPNSVKRLNIGGNNSFELFYRSIILKNPHLKSKLTYLFVKQIYEQYTYVAENYKEQLRYFYQNLKEKQQQNKNLYKNKVSEENKQIKQQINFIEGLQIDFDVIVQIPEEEIKRKNQVKKRMSEKLRETINRRKQMKKKMYQIELNNYKQLKEKYQNEDKFAHEQVVEIFGEHRAFQKLLKKIKQLEIKLGLVQQKADEKKFLLINIPDNQLPPEKLKFKKMQIYQKKALEERKEKKRQKESEQNRMKDLRQNNPELYLHQLKQKYNSMSKKIKESERMKKQLNNRKSKLKQRKMQAMARLVEEDVDDCFGQNEDDWLVYKDIEDSDHFSELDAMEAQLREIDPQWTQAKDEHHLKETNQLFILSDLIKCREIYFQPQIIGVNQAGLIETILTSIKQCPDNLKEALLQNIVVVGGDCQMKGLKERLQRDLRRECPIDLKIGVQIGKGGFKGAFLGMQNIAKTQRELIQNMSYKKSVFFPHKTEFVSNPWSNPSPKIS